MPLTAVSPNVRTHDRHNVKSSQAASRPVSSPKGPSSLAPGAVQSMLKTSTETGEIGQFSVRPSRIPDSASRIRTMRPRSGSFDSSFASTRQPLRSRSQRMPAPRNIPSLPGISRQATTRSNLTSYYHNPRMRLKSPRYRQYGLQELTYPTQEPHGFHGQRSSNAPKRRNLSGMTAASRTIYSPDRRPIGYHRILPAYNNIQGRTDYMIPPLDWAPSVGTASSSPVSAYRRRGLLDGPCHDVDDSTTSFVRLPSPAVSLLPLGHGRLPPPSRSGTAASCPMDYDGQQSDGVDTTRAMHRSATGSTIPLYYDYTESFAEDHSYSADQHLGSPASPFNLDQAIPEHELAAPIRSAQTPFGTRLGSVFQPSELPTDHLDTSSALLQRGASNAVIAEVTVCATSSSTSQCKSTQEKNPAETKNLSELIEAPDEDYDPSHSSKQSRRARSSSPSTSFFPNTSRSPRNLTSLAARVHSPSPGATPPQLPTFRSLNDLGGSQAPHYDNTRPPEASMPIWQLPSLNFWPLSILSTTQGLADRPKSSGGQPSVETSLILSPTPERPMSSQSRRRFKKILSINDDFSLRSGPRPAAARSYHSLNFAKLKRVVELPENRYSTRYPIPPYSPRASISQGRRGGVDTAEARPEQVQLWENTRQDQSTLDSLLDKHIACIGLPPDRAVDGTSETRQPSLPEPPMQKNSPREVFSNVASNGSRLAPAQSLPCMSAIYAAEGLDERPSTGWKPLSASIRLYSSSSAVPLLGERKYPEANKTLGPKPPQVFVPNTNFASSNNTSRNTEQRHKIDNQTPLEHHICDHGRACRICDQRKERTSLKLKRGSPSQGGFPSPLVAPRSVEGHPKLVPYQVLGPLRGQPVPANPGKPDGREVVSSVEKDSAPQNVQQKLSARLMAATQGSVRVDPPPPDVVPKVSHDLRARSSLCTVRSHQSNSSQAGHTSRTKKVAPVHCVGSEVPHIPAPDLGPPLIPSSMNMDSRCHDIRPMDRPVLPTTHSFFSDDSSAVHRLRGNVRKRFSLQGLKFGQRSSPKARNIKKRLRMSPSSDRSSIRHTGDQQTSRLEDEEQDLCGTTGMTEFAYRKRKMIEKLRDWWRRRVVPLAHGLRRKRSETDMAAW